MRRLAFLFVWLFATVSAAHAHQTALSYVDLRLEKPEATISVSVLDLEAAIGVDQDGDGRVVWGEVRQRIQEISGYVVSNVRLGGAAACTLTKASEQPTRSAGEAYLALTYAMSCPDGARASDGGLPVQGSIFADVDPNSRIFVRDQEAGGDRSYVLRADAAEKVSAAPAEPEQQQASGFLSFFIEGVEHLFGGWDHMLFLLVLIVPAIYATRDMRSMVMGVLLPITGFTLGHALTLTAAASGVIRLPTQVVETAIAVTILLTAIDNVRPFLPGKRSVLAFAFGLVHGLGFASALGALNLSGWKMAEALLGFNVGIETGQAVLAITIAPILYLLREPARRARLAPAGVSLAAGLMAMAWATQRGFGL